MFNSERNDLEGIGTIKQDVEQAILLHSWAQTSDCPQCGCDFTHLIGPETPTKGRHVEVVDCELCDAVMQAIVGEIDASTPL